MRNTYTHPLLLSEHQNTSIPHNMNIRALNNSYIYHKKHCKALFRCFSPLFHVIMPTHIQISCIKKCDKICRHVNEH